MPFLSVQKLSKHYGGIAALENIDFEIEKAEVHGLVGENGAGKSTFIKILGGIVQAESGEVHLEDNSISFDSPIDSRDAGIAIIHQELSVLPDLNIIENIFMGRFPAKFGMIDWNALAHKTSKILKLVGLDINPYTEMSALGISQRQLIEIAKSLSYDSRMIIMDEPNSSLTKSESNKLFELIQELKSKGITILYVSHKLDEVLNVCDRISVFRDGAFIDRFIASEIDEQKLVSKMVGRSIEETNNNKISAEDILLEVVGLSGRGFDDINFVLPKGTVTGFAGLVGAGRSEVARAIFGADPIYSGKLKYKGEARIFTSPKEAINNGLAMLAEDRKTLSLFLDQSIQFNMSLSKLIKGKKKFFNANSIKSFIEKYREKLKIKMSHYDETVGSLSGGNQQKTVLSRWLATEPELLILDEPTHGIDIGAKAEIYQLIRDLAAGGMTIMLISSEMKEILSLSDRVVVMHHGRLQSTLEGDAITEENIMSKALGVSA